MTRINLKQNSAVEFYKAVHNTHAPFTAHFPSGINIDVSDSSCDCCPGTIHVFKTSGELFDEMSLWLWSNPYGEPYVEITKEQVRKENREVLTHLQKVLNKSCENSQNN